MASAMCSSLFTVATSSSCKKQPVLFLLAALWLLCGARISQAEHGASALAADGAVKVGGHHFRTEPQAAAYPKWLSVSFAKGPSKYDQARRLLNGALAPAPNSALNPAPIPAPNPASTLYTAPGNPAPNPASTPYILLELAPGMTRLNISSVLSNGTRVVTNLTAGMDSPQYVRSVGNCTFSNVTFTSSNYTIVDVATNISEAYLNKECPPTAAPPPATAAPPATTPPPPIEKMTKSFPSWAIGLIVAAGVIGVVAVAGLVWFALLHKRSPYDDSEEYKKDSAPDANFSNALQSEEDIPPGALLSAANQARGAVALFVDNLWERVVRSPPARGGLTPRARAQLEGACARELLAHHEDPDFATESLRRSLSTAINQQAFFKAMFEDAQQSASSKPIGFADFLTARAQKLVSVLSDQLSLPKATARDLIFGPGNSAKADPSLEKAAFLTYLLHAAAFAFREPARLRWSRPKEVANPDMYRSCNPAVQSGTTAVSVFPAVILSSNVFEPGTVFASFDE